MGIMQGNSENDGHLKRLACQIYTQLPEDKREAMHVLRYVRQLVFCLGEEWETVSRTSVVLFPDQRDQEGRPAAWRAAQSGPQDKSSPE